jgi:hypothetical protein
VHETAPVEVLILIESEATLAELVTIATPNLSLKASTETLAVELTEPSPKKIKVPASL